MRSKLLDEDQRVDRDRLRADESCCPDSEEGWRRLLAPGPAPGAATALGGVRTRVSRHILERPSNLWFEHEPPAHSSDSSPSVRRRRILLGRAQLWRRWHWLDSVDLHHRLSGGRIPQASLTTASEHGFLTPTPLLICGSSRVASCLTLPLQRSFRRSVGGGAPRSCAACLQRRFVRSIRPDSRLLWR